MTEFTRTRAGRSSVAAALVAALLMAAAFLGVSPNVAGGQEPPEPGLVVTNDACRLTIVATVADAGSYTVDIWDDGEMIAFLTFTATVPGPTTLHYRVVRPRESPPEIGIYLMTFDGTAIDWIDPYEVTSCEAVTTTTVVEETSTTAVATTTTEVHTQPTNAPAKPVTPAPPAKSVEGEARYTG